MASAHQGKLGSVISIFQSLRLVKEIYMRWFFIASLLLLTPVLYPQSAANLLLPQQQTNQSPGRSTQYHFPTVNQLPVQKGFPNPFKMQDGREVKTVNDWNRQRYYLKALLAHYLYGTMPPNPGKVTIRNTSTRPTQDGDGVEMVFNLTITRGGKNVILRMGIVRPKGLGPYPVVIKNDRNLFPGLTSKNFSLAVGGKLSPRLSAEYEKHDAFAVQEALKRGYIYCKFIRTDLALDEPDNRHSGVFPLYPEYDWATIAVWSWGYQLVINALQEMDFVDTSKIVSTGHSRGGKTALCAAIYDERIAISAPNSSGTGGTGSFRFFEKGQRPQTVASQKERHSYWWAPRLLEFSNQTDKLPFDAHFMKALIAPRGLINPHSRQDYWANPYGTQLTHQAAQLVFDWLGVSNHNGIHWRKGGHAQKEEDWLALFDFADHYFLGKSAERKFDILAYPEAKPDIHWSLPASPPGL